MNGKGRFLRFKQNNNHRNTIGQSAGKRRFYCAWLFSLTVKRARSCKLDRRGLALVPEIPLVLVSFYSPSCCGTGVKTLFLEPTRSSLSLCRPLSGTRYKSEFGWGATWFTWQWRCPTISTAKPEFSRTAKEWKLVWYRFPVNVWPIYYFGFWNLKQEESDKLP